MSIDLDSILEREWWMMYHLKLSYEDICRMPLEYLEWFYKRHAQHLIDENERKKQEGRNG